MPSVNHPSSFLLLSWSPWWVFLTFSWSCWPNRCRRPQKPFSLEDGRRQERALRSHTTDSVRAVREQTEARKGPTYTTLRHQEPAVGINFKQIMMKYKVVFSIIISHMCKTLGLYEMSKFKPK